MPFERVRFVHAAGCLLDRPLAVRDEWPEPVRRTVRDAPLAAFRRLVALCIDEDVDFLLLVGDVFDDALRTLAGRLELREACDLLGEAGIRLFVVPGPCDPPAAWREAGVLDDHVALLAGEAALPCEVVRDGRPVVRFVAPDRGAATFGASPASSDGPRPLTIAARRAESDFDTPATCGADYVALGGTTRRTLETDAGGRLHDPGPLQGRGARNTGPHGATLATVGADGRLHLEFRPLAPVAWTARSTTLAPDLSPAELLSFLRHERDRHAADVRGADVELVAWTLHGRGAHLAQLLRDEAERSRLEGDLRDLGASEAAPARVYRLVCRPFDPRTTTASDDAANPWSTPRHAPLAVRFLEHLADVCQGPGAAGVNGPHAPRCADEDRSLRREFAAESSASHVGAAHGAGSGIRDGRAMDGDEAGEDERLVAALARAAREAGFDLPDLDEDRTTGAASARESGPVHAAVPSGPRHRLDLPHADEGCDRTASADLLLGPVGRRAADLVVPEEPMATEERRRLSAAPAGFAAERGTGVDVDGDAVREAARALGLTWFDHEASAEPDRT